MKLDVRVLFAALALSAAACSSGFDSGAAGGGMGGGDVAPPVNAQGAFGEPSPGASAGGPTAGPNGVAELVNPGSTLAPNQAQYPVGDGPTGMKCPIVQQFACSFSFNVPNVSPSPSPSPSPSGSPGSGKPKPTPTPTPTPTPAPASSDGDDSDATPTPSPTPPGTVTLQMEASPSDVPSMTNPDLRALRITPLVAIRLQSDTDFVLNGTAIASYALPATQAAGRSFVLQLYNESFRNKKRVDTFIGGYANATVTGGSVVFTFYVPKVVVRHGQIWLLALYGLTYPPGSTPTPSPSPSPSTAPTASGSPSPVPSPTH